MRLLIFLLLTIQTCYANTIEFVVTSGAGGPGDYVSRKLAERLELNSDLKFVVINKPGSGQKIGYSYIENSRKPTLFISTSEIEENTVNVVVYPLVKLGTFRNLIFVKRGRFDSLSDFKSHQIKFGHSGEGTFSHNAMTEMCKTIDCLPVPFKTGADGMYNIVNDTIDTYALVSYGSMHFTTNNNYRVIGEITLNNNWVKLFSKNLSDTQKQTVQQVIKNTDKKFFSELGLY